MTKVPPRSCSPFETPKHVPQFAFLFSPCYHHPSMNYHYIFLLLLVVLSAYSESPQYAKPPHIGFTVYPNSSSAQLGVLAPVLPQNEVFETVLPQKEVFKIVIPQNEVDRSVLPQNGVLIIANCQLSNKVKTIMDYLLNVAVKSSEFLPSILMHAGENLVWSIRILLECLQHVLKMYTWSLSENQASVQFRCKLIGLLLKQSLFRKHDFAAWVYRLYHCHQNLVFQHLKIFLAYRFGSCAQIREEHSKISNQFHFYGGGKSLIFSSDELLPYALVDLQEQQYQFLQCVKKDNKQSIVLGDGDILCSMPLNI